LELKTVSYLKFSYLLMLNSSQEIMRFSQSNAALDQLDESDWKHLDILLRILAVCIFFLFIAYIDFFFQVPFYYQQALSAEKTPTLPLAVIVFEGFLQSLRNLQDQLSGEGVDTEGILAQGISKLSEYKELISDVPAYYFAPSEWLYYL